jgi:type I restriction-modification system DNA methylase subunit
VVTTIVSARPPEIYDRPATIFDPAAGTGTLLLRAAKVLGSKNVSMCGQEINEAMSVIATANAFLAGVEGRFLAQDALAEDGFPDDSFDLAVSDPPYGLSWARLNKSLADDVRYGGGLPRRSDAALLFAQILASKLRPADEGGGRAVMLCAPHPLTEPSGTSIREWFLERDLVEAVVALPEGLSSETNIRLFALVLNNSKAKPWRGIVQVVDLRGSYVDVPKGHPERRRISENGLAELRRAIRQPKASSVARPLGLDHFYFNSVDITHTAIGRQIKGRPPAELSARVPRHRTLEDWASERYGVGAMPDLSLRRDEV